MNELEERVREFVLRELGERLRASGISPGDPADDLNLVTSGILDSMGFVELVGRLEQEFHVEVDFEGMDPGDFTTLGGLARCVARGRVDVPDRPGGRRP